MELTAIIAIIQAAVVVAPDVEAFAIKAKDFITALFTSNAITKAQQDAIHAHVDALAAAYKAGAMPPEFRVDPDPVS
jgi:hypothetical protein